MARIQADDRQTQRLERVPVPGRQQSALEADPCHSRCSPGEDSGNALRCRCTLALPEGRARLIHHAEACLLQRYVQANILLHGCSPLPIPSPILSDLTPPESSRPQLPHVAEVEKPQRVVLQTATR